MARSTHTEKLQRLLEDRKRKLTAEMHGMIRDVRNAGRTDERADDGQDVSEGDQRSDIELALIQMKAETVARIEAALRRLQDGTYGKCIECAGRISIERLTALPFALRCRGCEDSREERARERQVRPGTQWRDPATRIAD
jgi:DnaK suppressor protein